MICRSIFLLLVFCALYSEANSQAKVTLDSTEVERRLTKAWVYLEEPGKADSAIQLLLPAQNATSDEMGERRHARLAYSLYIAFRDNDQIDTALVYGEMATRRFLSIHDTLYSCFIMRALAEDYIGRGSFLPAIGHLHQATQMLEEQRDTGRLVTVHGVRVNLFTEMGEFKEGIAYGEAILPLAQSFLATSKDPYASLYYLHLLSAIAMNYKNLGEPKEAIKYLQIGESLIHQLPDSAYLTQNFEVMGEALLQLGELEKAEKYVHRALNLDRKDHFTIGVATHLAHLGQLAVLRGNLDDAILYLEEADSLALQLDNIEVLQDVYEYKFMHYKSSGELDQAIYYLQKHHNLKDSVLNIERIKVINELETRFESQKKDAELAQKQSTIRNQALLLERNALALSGLVGLIVILVVTGFLWRLRIRRKEAWARKQNELELRATRLAAMVDSQELERKRFSTDLHDGFGQMISVLRMNVQAIGDGPIRPNLLEQSVSVLDGMYSELQDICFNMMPRVLVKKGLVAALQEFAGRVSAAGKVSVSVGAFEMEQRLPERHEVALYRIAQEWINNILKHGNGNKIELQVIRDAEELTVTIEDNGDGFDPAALENGSGNGWKNIHYRSHLIRADLELDTRPNATGSTLILNVPMDGIGVAVNGSAR